MDKNTLLNEIVEAIYLEQGEKYIDTIKIVTSPNIPLLLSKQKKINYSKLFSYLGGGVKESPYIDHKSEKSIKKILNKKEKKAPINYEEIINVVKTSKMNALLGRSSEFINPKLKEKFDNFKIFNKQYVMLLYQIVDM